MCLKLSYFKFTFLIGSIFCTSYSFAAGNHYPDSIPIPWITCEVTDRLNPVTANASAKLVIIKNVFPYGFNDVFLEYRWYVEGSSQMRDATYPKYSDWNGEILKHSEDSDGFWGWRTDEFELNMTTGKGYYFSYSGSRWQYRPRPTINMHYALDDCKFIAK